MVLSPSTHEVLSVLDQRLSVVREMSSSDAKELKAGHPPAGKKYGKIANSCTFLFRHAVKAGGMRVVTKHRHKDHDSDAYDEKYQDSVNAMAPPVKYSQHLNKIQLL